MTQEIIQEKKTFVEITLAQALKKLTSSDFLTVGLFVPWLCLFGWASPEWPDWRLISGLLSCSKTVEKHI